jgi:hypothetical protein
MDRKPHWGAENARRRAAKAYDEVAAFWDERGYSAKASRERGLAGKERKGAELERLRARRGDGGAD